MTGRELYAALRVTSSELDHAPWDRLPETHRAYWRRLASDAAAFAALERTGPGLHAAD